MTSIFIRKGNLDTQECLSTQKKDHIRTQKVAIHKLGREDSKETKPVVVQSLSCSRLLVTLWTAACWACLSFTLSQSLLKLMSIELVMSSNHLILYCPLLLLPSIVPASGSFPVNLLFASAAACIKLLHLQLQII